MAVNAGLVRRGFSVFLPTALALSISCARGSGAAESADESLVQADTTERDGELGRRVAIRFAVEVVSDVSGPIYVLLNGEDNQPGWIRASRGRERVYFRERCEIEDCVNPRVVCGAAISMIKKIADAGQAGMIEFIWDGITSVLDSVAGCEIREPAPPGDYVARFCYSRKAEFEGGGDPARGVPGRLVDTTCAEQPFTLNDRQVVLTI